MVDIPPDTQLFLDCDGHALVTGGPGSGKTTLALRKAIRRVQSGMSPGQSVLFLSFSRAAVARIIEAAKIEVAKEQRNRLSIHTFHSFFWELLRSHAYLLGTPVRLRILLPHDERVLSNGIKPDNNLLWPVWIGERDRLFRDEGRIGFDLFAPKAVVLLEKSMHLRQLIVQRYPLLIVDEAQDTNPDAWRCIELLSHQAQVICLADLQQQIFDYLPGIGPERIEAIRLALCPLEVNLGTQNHRSPSSEIVIFGRDILAGRSGCGPYRGVSRLIYNPKTLDRAKMIRMALGILQKEIRQATGDWGRSIAILFPTGSSAARYSAAMNASARPLRHKLLFDEADAMLAARFAAFLLEPPDAGNSYATLAQALELLANMQRASGGGKAKSLLNWSEKVRLGKIPAAGLVKALRSVLENVKREPFVGDPAKDWATVKRVLRESGDDQLTRIATHLDYVIAFGRGKRISAGLAEMWQLHGQYTHARQALELALAQDQVLGGVDDPMGVQVMTIHKAKGKQFDGVIVVREGRNWGIEKSSFVWVGDAPPYPRSRRILHVAVTRAKVHTLVLDPAWPVCPILSHYRL